MATLIILLVMVIRFHTLHSQSYMLQKEALNFEDADALCLFNYDRHLASIHTLKALIDANRTRGTYGVWIGLTEITHLWTYVDSTSFEYGSNPIGISPPWFTDEPNDYYSGTEDCVEMKAAMHGFWNDAQCSNLRYALCNYPKPIYILKDPSDYQRIPTSNHSIGYIDILDEVYVEFDVILHSYPESCATILHFGDTNISQSFPGICISGSQKFYLRFSLVSNFDPVHTTDVVNLSTLYHVTLYQTQQRLTITMNNMSVYDNETASHPIMFHRTMYFGDPWHDAANATLSNVIVTTSNSHAPNSFNYICEGWNRWTNISGSWTWSVSNAANTCEMNQNNESYDGAVAWLGTLDPSSIAWTDYKIQVKFTINSADYGVAGILFRAKSISPINHADQQYFLGVSVPENRFYLGIINDSWLTLQTRTVSVAYGQKYTLRIEVTGKMLEIYWGNEFLFSYNNIVYLFGSVALRTWRATATFSSVNIAFPSDSYLLTVNPSMQPTTMPSFQPTNQPITTSPTIEPTLEPTNEPTFEPTTFPTNSTENPTASPITYSPTTHSPTTLNPTLSEMTTLGPIASTSTLWTTQISSTLSEDEAAETTPFQQRGHENVYKKEKKNDMVFKISVCVIILLGIVGGVMMIALCKKKRKERLEKKRKNVGKSIVANIALTAVSSASITEKVEEHNSAAMCGSEVTEVNINCNSQQTENENENIVINASYIATMAPPRRKNESIVDILEGNVEIIADKTSGLDNETQGLNIRNDEFVVGTDDGD